MSKTQKIMELEKEIADLKTINNLNETYIKQLEERIEKLEHIPERFSPKSDSFLMTTDEYKAKLALTM